MRGRFRPGAHIASADCTALRKASLTFWSGYLQFDAAAALLAFRWLERLDVDGNAGEKWHAEVRFPRSSVDQCRDPDDFGAPRPHSIDHMPDASASGHNVVHHEHLISGT